MLKLCLILSLNAVLAFSSIAQLAITEVQTSESTTAAGQAGAPAHVDWWELSNYGSTDIDLTGYSWNDDSHGGLAGADTTAFTAVVIHKGETIVFSQTGTVITTPDAFRQWWNLAPTVNVVLYPAGNPGLGSGGDTVRIWNTNGIAGDEAQEFLVDRVDLPAATAGRSFVYNAATGQFDIKSTNGIAGAFKAATADDEGSPGVAPASVALQLTREPTNYSTTIGSAAVFTASATGFPKPKYQWLFNGNPIDKNTPGLVITNINGISTLTLTSAQVANNGNYKAVATNGVGTITTSNAVLSVLSAPTPPEITSAPQSVNAYLGQIVTFTVQATGNPTPTFVWKYNNNPIGGETGSQLIRTLSDTNQSGIYTVVLSNPAGSTNASATLSVTPKPNLVITEVMSSEATPSTGHADWFELSNFGTFAVDLHGFRMNDAHLLSAAYTITNKTFIKPGESVVFVEGLSAQEFKTWWGSNLPPNLQIISYSPTGRGLSGTSDEVRLWNQAATDDADRITSVSFSTATVGNSFGFDNHFTTQDGFVGNSTDGLTTNGVNGAFAAAVSGDIGSPGMLVTWPRLSTIAATGGSHQITFSSESSVNYDVEYKNSFSDTAWTYLSTSLATGSQVTVTDPANVPQRFYRVVRKTTP